VNRLRSSVRAARRIIPAARAAFAARRRHRAIARAGAVSSGRPEVSYGFDHLPGPGEAAYGGLVKLQPLQKRYPNAPRDFNVLYLVSSFLPSDAHKLIELTRGHGASFVWNQNGVGYPAWAGDTTDAFNARLRDAYLEADHVLFQSEFCRVGAERWLGHRKGPGEVLYNPVDTQRFTPSATPPKGAVLLLAGNQYRRYRLATAMEVLAHVAAERGDARLIVTGALSWSPDARVNREEALRLARELGVADRVELLGLYTQAEAPEIFRRAHVLLHTKVNDPCPGVVLEAMACGLPVAYSASGGVPELVGEEAGIGVESVLDWERMTLPDAGALARAVLALLDRGAVAADASRARAVELFDVQPWIARHAEVFEGLVSGR
jgi:glycosyltransferase involved in cell wall biosynthesis